MTLRLNELFSLIPFCKTFADVGCDHGYISYEMLKQKKAQNVCFSDISEKCLSKAEKLLFPFISKGLARGYVSNGFEKLPKVDCALVAGMGGEEIISILNNAPLLPETLVLQPMKNTEKLRVCLIEKGYKILKDYTFFANKKYYDVILCEKGVDVLTDDERLFGRTNILLKPVAFLEKLREKKREITGFLQKENLSQESRRELLSELERIDKIC